MPLHFECENNVIDGVLDEGFSLKLSDVDSGRMRCGVAVPEAIIQDLGNVLVHDLLPLADVDNDGLLQIH